LKIFFKKKEKKREDMTEQPGMTGINLNMTEQEQEQSATNVSWNVFWVSIDPVRRKLDFYPSVIARRLEKSYGERDQWTPSQCVLGSDFFNSTVHFHPSGSCYQTTPGLSLGRSGYKQPGYRSVKRIVKDPENPTVTVYAKQVRGECRLALTREESDREFTETIPLECLVESGSVLVDTVLKVWTGDDLTSGLSDTNVVVWQWCRGVAERQGNLMTLSDEWWSPYLVTENKDIEAAFSSGERSVDIGLAFCGTRTFQFTRGQMFASQNDTVNRKTRMVRRVIKTIQEVNVMLERMSTPPVDISQLLTTIEGPIPQHFFCCITQDVMTEPVKTIDGHIYDRLAIERWIEHNTTSPLTGLRLISTILAPQNELRQQIEEFVQSAVTEQLSAVNVNDNTIDTNDIAELVSDIDQSDMTGNQSPMRLRRSNTASNDRNVDIVSDIDQSDMTGNQSPMRLRRSNTASN